MGYASFSRSGDLLTLRYTLVGDPHGARTWTVELFDGSNCSTISSNFFVVNTDANGNGTDQDSINVAGHSTFFAWAHTPFFTAQNGTRTVKAAH